MSDDSGSCYKSISQLQKQLCGTLAKEFPLGLSHVPGYFQAICFSLQSDVQVLLLKTTFYLYPWTQRSQTRNLTTAD